MPSSPIEQVQNAKRECGTAVSRCGKSKDQLPPPRWLFPSSYCRHRDKEKLPRSELKHKNSYRYVRTPIETF